MNDLLLHNKTSEQLQKFLNNTSHGVLIGGQAGSGKRTIAETLASRLIGIPQAKLSTYPQYIVIAKPAGKQEIPIELIRQLISSLKLTPAVIKRGTVKRVVLIDSAQLLSEEAQNALLKLLEEPPQSTTFILTTPNDKNLLPTVVSRLQKITVSPVGLDRAQTYFRDSYSTMAISSAWSLSQGAVGLMMAILHDDENHPLKLAVDSAKRLLRMDRYERLIFLDDLSREKEELKLFIEGLARVLSALQRSAAEANKDSLSRRVVKGRRLVSSAAESLDKNTSIRLICLNLALNLPI